MCGRGSIHIEGNTMKLDPAKKLERDKTCVFQLILQGLLYWACGTVPNTLGQVITGIGFIVFLVLLVYNNKEGLKRLVKTN